MENETRNKISGTINGALRFAESRYREKVGMRPAMFYDVIASALVEDPDVYNDLLKRMEPFAEQIRVRVSSIESAFGVNFGLLGSIGEIEVSLQELTNANKYRESLEEIKLRVSTESQDQVDVQVSPENQKTGEYLSGIITSILSKRPDNEAIVYMRTNRFRVSVTSSNNESGEKNRANVRIFNETSEWSYSASVDIPEGTEPIVVALNIAGEVGKNHNLHEEFSIFHNPITIEIDRGQVARNVKDAAKYLPFSRQG